jgi:hypothetical protein
MHIVITKTVDEVLEKYIDAEKIDPPWDRVTVFSWDDMLALEREIKRLRANDAVTTMTVLKCEVEQAHRALDELGLPREQDNGLPLSLEGRIRKCEMLVSK